MNNSLYVRVKRDLKTFFFVCEPTDHVESLKNQLKSFFEKVENNDLRLYLGDRLLDERSTIKDQNVLNDCIIYLKMKKQNGEWEE